MSDWKGKVVLVTGGSSGLGLELVRAFAERGATVVAVARQVERLEAAVASASTASGRVVGWPCDVTNDEEVARLREQVTTQFGRLDVLINNVGVSTRGELLSTPIPEFQRLWELNFLTAVRCTQSFAELLAGSRGHVVNIGSLASKSAARYLGGYAPSKFAVAAFSQQLRYEWAERGVHVLLVCPGPLRRDDAGERYSAQAAGLPEAARKPGGGVRVKGLDPAWLARRIIVGCERREPEIVAPWKARVLFAVQQLSPRLGDWLVKRMTGG
ncbi:MAG: SDR family NAD(P)-dependent oxidoreductase [Pirellulales bacterium]